MLFLGYVQRRLTTALEAVYVRNDGTCRDAQGRMVQQTYGNGFDCAFLEKVKMFYLKTTSFKPLFTEAEWATFSELRRKSLKCKLSLLNKKLDVTAYMPVNIEAILLQQSYSSTKELDQEKVFKAVQGILNQFLKLKCDTLFMRTSLAFFLRWSNVAKYSLKSWIHIVDEISFQCNRAIIQPGEMIGNLAAESCGEIVTQLTLDTFHHCGIASLNDWSSSSFRCVTHVKHSFKVKNFVSFHVFLYSTFVFEARKKKWGAFCLC